ncbi:DUF262 domain-containing protein [Nocardioides sp. P5_E3]
MKGYLTAYANLFEGSDGPRISSIEIPLIQRDYAQGRTSKDVEDVRNTFVEVLIDALAGGDPLSLDFIYGKVTKETGVFHPLDGQQRLTTLFLIHWYLASTAGTLDASQPWTRLTYATRPSARLFCESLVHHAMPKGEEVPSDWIKDQPWFLHTWQNDPTIDSMLVMVDAIHTRATTLPTPLDASVAWARLRDIEDPAISFYLLPLEDMDSAEDLYIKMNSRGKPLTEFEHFKARFEQDISHSARADDFAHLIDGRWSDLMWPIHGGDNIVDDELIRYIDYLTEICELRQDLVTQDRIGPRARAMFGPDNPRADEHLGFLFSAFNVWLELPDIGQWFADHFSSIPPGGEGYDPGKALLFGTDSVNLFEQCCHQFDSQKGGTRTFTLQQSLLLYAVLLHLIEHTEDFPRRLRMLRNLLAASVADEIRRQNMPGLLADVESIVRHGDLDGVGKLSRKQVDNEKRKAEFLDEHPDLAPALLRLEDHPLLRGTLSAFELDAERLPARAKAFADSFSDPRQWLDLTGALLATGDYQRRRPQTEQWQFGTAAPNNAGVWRYLLTDATHQALAPTRAVLGAFLDGAAERQDPFADHLQEITSTWLREREEKKWFDWRYYLVKYPALRGERDDRQQGRTGIYTGIATGNGYSMCMMRTVQFNGLYRDPILLQIWINSQVGDAVKNPWFTGYPSSHRWMRLERSSVGLRSVDVGFEIDGPEDETLSPTFNKVCDGRPDVTTRGDGRLVLRIPQQEVDGLQVDTVNRVDVGADFLKELVAAGL